MRRSRSFAFPAVSGVSAHSVVGIHRPVYPNLPVFDNWAAAGKSKLNATTRTSAPTEGTGALCVTVPRRWSYLGTNPLNAIASNIGFSAGPFEAPQAPR